MYTEKAIQYVLKGYLIFLGIVFPLFLGNNIYSTIAHDKYSIFKKWTFYTECVFLVLLCFNSTINRKPMHIKIDLQSLLPVVFTVFVCISWWFSFDRKESLIGAYGWYLGLKTFLMLLVLYYMYGQFYSWSIKDTFPFLIGSFLVMLLAVLNRYRILLLDSENYIATYISTIGNINWLAGYLSITFPFGFGLYISNIIKNRWLKLCLLAYIFIGWLAVLTNGSNSVYLWVLAMLVFSIIYGLSSYQIICNLINGIIVCGLACIWLFATYLIVPLRQYYLVLCNEQNYSLYITSNFSCIILTCLLIAGYCCLKKQKMVLQNYNYNKPFLIMLISGMILIILLLFVQLSNFDIPGEFGHNRFFLWNMSAGLYKEFNGLRKLIGIGPDCFARYTLSDWNFMMKLMELYPEMRLVNAHSEPLTMMINLGMSGATLYYGMVFSHLYYRIDSTKTMKGLQTIVSITLICYHVNLLVSFHTIITMPYLYLLLALASSFKNRQLSELSDDI